MNRLFIIGNGFDKAHNLPTDFKEDFKRIAEKVESIPYFWDIYQTREIDIWSNFEHCLAHPDFNELEQIFDGYAPDYSSDYERNRTGIITQVDLNACLIDILCIFANKAEKAIENTVPEDMYVGCFDENDLFINFNYTHTLERLYEIDDNKVLHVHGEVGKDNLIIGYPSGEYEPEKYSYDYRQKGRGSYTIVDIREHIENMAQNEMIDYYTYEAYKSLIGKTESFCKYPQLDLVEPFLKDQLIKAIVVLGHSCSIDFEYFDYVNKKYPSAKWVFNPYNDEDGVSIEKLIQSIGIKNYIIK